MGIFNNIGYLSRRTWVIEALAMTVSVGCLSGIVAILAMMHDSRLSKWKAPFSVTATVSALITVSKSTLLLVVASCISQRKWKYFQKPRPLLDFDTFDGASRGPLGAVELLFGKAIYAKTAALGAFITTIALAWDPSAQLLIEFETRSVQTYDPRANFGHNNRFYTKGFSRTHIKDGTKEKTYENTELLAVIMNSLYGKIPERSFSCPTGKCDWTDEYLTLGFTSNCSDVTAQSKRVCSKHLIDTETEDSLQESFIFNCNITTPSGVKLSTKYESRSESQTLQKVSSVKQNHTCSQFYGSTGNVATLAMYRQLEFYDSPSFETYDKNPLPWEATECNITVVALTHSEISVRNNSLHIGRTSVTRLTPDISPDECPLDDSSLESPFAPILLNDTHKSSVGSQPQFEIQSVDWLTLLDMLHETVFGDASLDLIVGDDLAFVKAQGWLDLSAFRDSNITVLSANVASAMTNYVQTDRPRDGIGYSYSDEIFVRVRRGWFVVHLVTVVAAVILVVITYTTHTREGKPAWKESNVALLLHRISGMDEEEWRAIEASKTVEDYEKAVDKYVEGVWVRSSDKEMLCLEKVDLHAAEEGIPLIAKVDCTAPKVSE